MGNYVYDYGAMAGAGAAVGGFTIIIILIALLSYIFPPIICAVKAQEKGRSVGWWVFGGMVLAWIGVIIICCLSDIRPRSKKPFSLTRSTSEGGHVCPKCGYSDAEGSTATGSVSSTSKPTAVRSDKKVDRYRCAECGEMIDSLRCPWCGATKK